MIKIRHKGDFRKISKFNREMLKTNYKLLFEKYGRLGVEELAKATPMRTGKTAASWFYKVEQDKRGIILSFDNSNTNENVKIALVIQYGRGTSSGGYIKGRDYIKPVISKLFEDLVDKIWWGVTKQ